MCSEIVRKLIVKKLSSGIDNQTIVVLKTSYLNVPSESLKQPSVSLFSGCSV